MRQRPPSHVYCPYCECANSKVIDSRDSGDGIRRRRVCLECERRFTTYEYVQMRTMMVVKRDKRREEFQREKLFASLAKACAKRPLPIGAIEKTLDEIEATLSELGRAEVTARFIGELVMEKLRELDRVAYIRFASVYSDFSDIESFKQEVDALLDSGESSNGIHPDQIRLLEDDATSRSKRKRRPRRRTSKRPQVNPA